MASENQSVCAHVWEDTGWTKPMSPPIAIYRCQTCGEEGWLRHGETVVEARGYKRDATDWGALTGSGSPLADGAGQTGESIETHGWSAETTDKE